MTEQERLWRYAEVQKSLGGVDGRDSGRGESRGWGGPGVCIVALALRTFCV